MHRDSVTAALCVHGAGGGGWEWNLWRGVLVAAGLRVHCPDLQPAAAGLARTTLDDYVTQVQASLQDLPRRRVLIGASLGALIAMQVASAADALVLVNPLPPSPWHAQMPARDWPDEVGWHTGARLASTRRAMPDADDATTLYAFMRWRNESGEVLRRAHAGIDLPCPPCPILCIASRHDDDVPLTSTLALAQAWRADLLHVDSDSHVGPLLGRGAVDAAAAVASWLSTR